jgi:hypothetical protein
MAVDINTVLDAWTNITITLAALASGSSRQSNMITNTNSRPAALIEMDIESGGTAPTNGTTYEIFLLRGDDAGNRTDNAGASDAAITIENAQLLGTLVVTNTINMHFADIFTTHTFGALGTVWGIAVRNSSGQSLIGT